MSVAQLREKYRATKRINDRYDDLFEEAEQKRKRVKKELMDGEEKFECSAESMSQALPLRKAEKRLSRKFNNLSEDHEKLEEELAVREKSYGGMRSVVDKLVNEKWTWSEERDEYRELVEEIRENVPPTAGFRKMIEKFVARLKSVLEEDDSQCIKDLNVDVKNLFEAHMEHLSDKKIGHLWKAKEKAQERIRELERRIEELENERFRAEGVEARDSDESTSSADSE